MGSYRRSNKFKLNPKSILIVDVCINGLMFVCQIPDSTVSHLISKKDTCVGKEQLQTRLSNTNIHMAIGLLLFCKMFWSFGTAGDMVKNPIENGLIQNWFLQKAVTAPGYFSSPFQISSLRYLFAGIEFETRYFSKFWNKKIVW